EKTGRPSRTINSNSIIYNLSRQNKEESFVGTWKLYLVPNGKYQAQMSKGGKGRTFSGPETFAASVKSNFKLEDSALSSKNEPGAEINLIAQATEENLPLENATITVTVRSPDGKTTKPMTLENSNKAGEMIFMGKFFNTTKEGTYQFSFKAEIKNN